MAKVGTVIWRLSPGISGVKKVIIHDDLSSLDNIRIIGKGEKMTKREAAEINVKYKGNILKGALPCAECCHILKCRPRDPESAERCLKFCRQWLKDNPEESVSDWKELNDDEYEIDQTESGIRYRKIQPKAVKHEDILDGRYWKFGESWKKMVGYENGIYRSESGTGWTKGCFTGRESATIPPESKS